MMRPIHQRLDKLEAKIARKTHPRPVRLHIVDCEPDQVEAQIAVLTASEPDALHICNVIVTPPEPMETQG